MNAPVAPSPVLIAIGPEWAPLREITTGFLASCALTGIDCIATLASDPMTPEGRVANWAADTCGGTIVRPGTPLPQGNPVVWAGVAELLLDPDPFQVEQLYALGIWTRYVSRRDRLKLRVSPTLPADIVANAVRFAPRLQVMVGEWQGQRVVLAGTDPVATEVTARAFRAIAQPAGDIGHSPWQAPIVQAAIERGLGVSGGGKMCLDLKIGSPIDPRIAAESNQILERIRRTLDTSTA